MKQMRKRQPKFKVGDKVKNIWNENVYTVASIKDGGYMLDDRYLPFDDEMCWVLADAPESRPEPTPESTHKFKGYTVNDRYIPFDKELSWSLSDKPESTPESRSEPTRKFNIGDIVQRKDGCCFQYRIMGYDGDDYVAVDTFKLERGLKSPFDITKIGMNDNEYELVEKAESNVQPFVPKFKVGDIINPKKISQDWTCYVITEIKEEGYHAIQRYAIDDRRDVYIPFNEEDDWGLTSDAMERAKNEKQEPVPKFKVGDRVKHKVVDPHNPATEYIYTVFEIENDKYCLDHNDHESWIPISAQDEFELCTVSLEQINTDIDEIWKNTLVNMINHITKRNTASFMYIINETLRYMDCDAYVEDARAGMRQFVKELKKRLTA